MQKRKRASNDHSRAPEVLNALERKKLEQYDPNTDPWERQPIESARNHGFFMLYRDFGRIRTVRQVAEVSNLSYAAMARLARCNKWVERAGLWDAEQDRIMNIRLYDAREEMAKRHAKIAGMMLEKGLERLRTLDPKMISPNALILLISEAAKIERAALGLETLNKGASAAQTSVTVAASTSSDEAGQPTMRVEVGVRHDQINASLDELVKRMSPEQIAAGYEELTASAQEALAGLDAALPAAPPPPGQ